MYVQTQYRGATNTRPSQIKVSARIGDKIRSEVYGLAYENDEHRVVAQYFVEDHFPGKTARYIGSSLDGRGNVYLVE